MRRRSMLPFLQTFGSVHRSMMERDFADASRREAEMARAAIATAQASGVLGNGRLANLRDAHAANMLNPNGLFLGALNKRPLFYNGDAPLLTYARTGTGKGRDFILPNLAHSRNRSLIVVDVKDAENCFASHVHRRDNLGHKIVYLNPFELLGLPNARINPLQTLIDVVSAGGQIDTEAAEIAHILLPPSPKDQNGDWVGSGARRILALRMEYLACFEPELCNLGGLWRFVNSSQMDLDMAFAMMTTCGVDGIERRAHAVQATAADAPKQHEAYKSACIDALDPFEPAKRLERATAAHDFDFARLKHEPHTVYLMAPSEKLSVVAIWVSLIVSHIIETVARERGPVATTLILDEFPQLPPSPSIKKMLHLYRGKGLQPWIFAQGRHLLEGKWSRDAVKDFEDSAAILNTSCVEDPEVMSDIEKWSGNRTVLMHGMNRSGGTVESAGANLGESKRAVLQSENIREIGDGRQIIRVAGMPHLIKCDRIPFFEVDPWKFQIRDVRDLHKGVSL
ncbi:type IV secretory system conjugative DNA transfer family protein [Sphingobium sp.]|uniref:type IV secretory system conjugative DNA transfer family protein n=1 Tax=Sphingobium sp. TaxID=1912891 RepID=UPI003BB4BA53